MPSGSVASPSTTSGTNGFTTWLSSGFLMTTDGVELGGGSIRIHQPDVQKTVFEEVLQIPPEETKLRFGYMLEAFRYGVPPHAGFAFGIDRVVMMLAGTENIRDVIAFPKTSSGQELLTGAPSIPSPDQLSLLGIRVVEPPKRI